MPIPAGNENIPAGNVFSYLAERLEIKLVFIFENSALLLDLEEDFQPIVLKRKIIECPAS